MNTLTSEMTEMIKAREHEIARLKAALFTPERVETIKARPADNYVAFNEAVKPSWIALKGVFLTIEERDALIAALEDTRRERDEALVAREEVQLLTLAAERALGVYSV